MSDIVPASTPIPLPRTPAEWVMLGVSIGASMIVGAVARAAGISKRLDVTESTIAAAQTAVRAEIAAVAARADAAVQTAQAAAAGAHSSSALRQAIADELGRDPRIQTHGEEIRRLRDAADKGAENTLRMSGAIERIGAQIERL